MLLKTLLAASIGLFSLVGSTNAAYLYEPNCKGKVIATGSKDFYDTYVSASSSSGIKAGGKVYAGQNYDVAAYKDGYVGLVVGQNTIGYVSEAVVQRACGDNSNYYDY
jgi:hypothetical protein